MCTRFSMCCYLYRKRVLHPRFQSYQLHMAILGMVKAQSKCGSNKVENANSRDDKAFIPRYRKATLSTSPRCRSPSQRVCPRKGTNSPAE